MDARSRTNDSSDATSGCTAPPATPPQSKFLPAAAPTAAAVTEKDVGTYRPPHVRAQSMRGPMDRPSTESQAVVRPARPPPPHLGPLAVEAHDAPLLRLRLRTLPRAESYGP
jgi:hypothetical protein